MVALEIDHIIPRSAGGTNALENITTACVDCNVGKGKIYDPSTRNEDQGGRPNGVTMPCGWCGSSVNASGMRRHFVTCPKKPSK